MVSIILQGTDVMSSQHNQNKGAIHQCRSAEPGSTLIVDLNQVQVMMRCTIVKLGSADVV